MNDPCLEYREQMYTYRDELRKAEAENARLREKLSDARDSIEHILEIINEHGDSIIRHHATCLLKAHRSMIQATKALESESE